MISSHFIRASKKGQNNGIKLVITNGRNTNLTVFINIRNLLYTSVVSMKWLLLGSLQIGQAAKHVLCRLHIHNFSHCGHFWTGRQCLVVQVHFLPHLRFPSHPNISNLKLIWLLLYTLHVRQTMLSCGSIGFGSLLSISIAQGTHNKCIERYVGLTDYAKCPLLSGFNQNQNMFTLWYQGYKKS